jgi:hypothetical protein
MVRPIYGFDILDDVHPFPADDLKLVFTSHLVVLHFYLQTFSIVHPIFVQLLQLVNSFDQELF